MVDVARVLEPSDDLFGERPHLGLRARRAWAANVRSPIGERRVRAQYHTAGTAGAVGNAECEDCVEVPSRPQSGFASKPSSIARHINTRVPRASARPAALPSHRYRAAEIDATRTRRYNSQPSMSGVRVTGNPSCDSAAAELFEDGSRTRLQCGGLLWDAHIFGNAIADRSADSREAETNRATHTRVDIECRSPARVVAEDQHDRSARHRPEHRRRRLNLARPHADEHQVVRGTTRVGHDTY